MKIEEVERMLEGITPGEWHIDQRADTHVISTSGRGVANCGGYFTNSDNGEYLSENYCNAKFIAAAPQIIRDLIAQVKEVRKAAFLEAAEIADKIRMNAFIEPLQKMHPTQQIVIELRRKAEET